MKKGLVLVLGVLVVWGSSLSAGNSKDPLPTFTLAASAGGELAAASPRLGFRLAGSSIGASGREAPAGLGDVEDNYGNTGYGINVLYQNQGGAYNTAIGYEALYNNTMGGSNTVSGFQALYNNTWGYRNVAVGYLAMHESTTGFYNMAVGTQALYHNTSGLYNTASGDSALYSNTTGLYNTAIGESALYSNTTGACNIGIGVGAGSRAQDGNDNIHIGAYVTGPYSGVLDTNTIRIGRPYDGTTTPPEGQSRTFIAGIVESPLTAEQAPAVVGILGNGRLGTLSPESLPPGPRGPQGDPGPAGEGLVSGSLLFLRAGIVPPAGYTLLGTQTIQIKSATGRSNVIYISVWQKN